MRIRPSLFTALLVSSALTVSAGCSSSSDSSVDAATPKDAASTSDAAATTDTAPATGDASSGGGPVAGAADMHCAGKPAQMTSQDVCKLLPPDGGVDAGEDTPDYGDTMYNAEGDDDDCKYHVKFTYTPILENTDVYFTVTVTNTVDGKPTTGAALEAEVFLDTTHPAPSTGTFVESPAGTYKVGPVRFDASGKWTVRYHAFETCTDVDEASPHGHAAFYINVP